MDVSSEEITDEPSDKQNAIQDKPHVDQIVADVDSKSPSIDNLRNSKYQNAQDFPFAGDEEYFKKHGKLPDGSTPKPVGSSDSSSVTDTGTHDAHLKQATEKDTDKGDKVPERFVQKDDDPNKPLVYSKAGKLILGEWVGDKFARYKPNTPRPAGFTPEDWGYPQRKP